jgi:hypothetical protein
LFADGKTTGVGCGGGDEKNGRAAARQKNGFQATE